MEVSGQEDAGRKSGESDHFRPCMGSREIHDHRHGIDKPAEGQADHGKPGK